MSSGSSLTEYTKALRLGQKERKDLADAGCDPYPAVLETLLPELSRLSIQDLPLQDIPADRIIGTKTTGRMNAFSAGFYPLLEPDSEFAGKWMALCDAHLSDTGIREPVICYEYLGSFYVQEGNKRVSVLKSFGAARIPALIKRVLPAPSGDARIRTYAEFLDFYHLTQLYDIQYKKTGEYARLLALLKKAPDEKWTPDEQRVFLSRFHSFKEAFNSLEGKHKELSPEEALLLWLKVYDYEALSSMGAKELKTSLAGLWGDVVAGAAEETPSLRTAPESESRSLLGKLITPAPAHLTAAFLYQQDCEASLWTRAHKKGAEEMGKALASQVDILHYDHADSPEAAETLLDRAVSDGADLIFTTTPLMLQPALKAAVRYPKLRILNCSVDTALSSVRSYYCRAYEGKFITGLIAGAMAKNDLIGYVGSYPILGVPASLCAFAIGARMTNPRARILLEWSCVPGNAAERLASRGARIISNRDLPMKDTGLFESGEYGTCFLDDDGRMQPLASPVWLWDRVYEQVVRSVLSGSWTQKKEGEAINYYWGMDSGAIDVEMTGLVPEGPAALARHMISALQEGRFDPFRCRILAQDGSIKNDGSHGFTPLDLLRMDWLPENVEGRIPDFDELAPISQPLVRELGLKREI